MYSPIHYAEYPTSICLASFTEEYHVAVTDIGKVTLQEVGDKISWRGMGCEVFAIALLVWRDIAIVLTLRPYSAVAYCIALDPYSMMDITCDLPSSQGDQ